MLTLWPAGGVQLAWAEQASPASAQAAPPAVSASGPALPRERSDATARVPEGATPEERVRAMRQRQWEVRARRAQTPIRMDGRLDEPDWDAVAPAAEFYQRERRDVIPSSERTEVRVLYDDRMLYVGFRCFDREPALVRARALFRDESGASDDLVSFLLDSYNDQRTAIQFVSNMNGLIEDLSQLGETESTRNHDFDTVWHSHGRRTDTGYEVEMAVPFTSLRFPRRAAGEEIVFGIGFKRNIPRKNEEMTWPFVSNDSSWYRPAELGRVHGITDIEPGRNLQVRPYALGGASQDLVSDTRDERVDAGVDVKWSVTTGLTADFSVNTDFAQEEADVQQVNLTRFSLFFPEKRQFFLEGQQMFQFGLPREVDLVFTRRIGLSALGEVVPIDWGARLSGRQGRTSIGAMNIQTDSHMPGTTGLELPGENFTVLRVKQDVLSRSSVGALFTNADNGPRANRVIGGDARFLFKRIYVAEGFAVAQDDTALGRAGALYGRTGVDADRYGAIYRYLDVDEAFSPAVGYVQRPDSRQHAATLRFSPRPASDVVRQFHFTGLFDYITDQAQVLETRNRGAKAAIDFESGEQVSVQWLDTLEAITEPFRLRPGVVLQPGAYRFDNLEMRLDTFRRRPATVNLAFTTGGFWSGDRDALSVRAGYRITKNLGVSGGYDVNWVDLPEGAFTTHLASTRVQIAMRNDVALLTLFQYNHDTRQFSSNIRFNWIPKPGTDFFIVYNELDTSRGGWQPRNRSLVVKLNYLFQL